jgi:aryl-alcohol dehydrogenase-like predicted oxidoreductase
MLYRTLGRTGLRVSEIGLGCASYWGKKNFSEAEAIRIVHAASDCGVTFFDTGASYSGGNAEPRLGRALLTIKDKHDLVVATKAGSYTDEQNKRREDFSPLGVRRTVEASLVRLGLDSIPLLHLHGPEIPNLTDDLLDTLGRLKEAGKVRHLSVNSFDEEVLQHVATIPLFEAVMVDYSILRPEREPIIKKLATHGVGVLAGMALGGGLYRNRFQIRRIQDAWYFARAWKNHRTDIKRGKALRFIDQEKGWTGGEIAISWVLRNPDVSCAVFGTTRMAHLTANLQASGKPVDTRILDQISKAQLSFG